MKTKHIITAIAAMAAFNAISPAAEPPAPYGAVPTEQQIQWQRMELYAFIHFGINTYNNQEWGEGSEDPSVLNPSDFNADEIVASFKEAGMTGLIFTAKHHDGFCLWPTKSTSYNITKSPWRNGKGDMVREFADACKRHGLKFGVYVSPWDRNNAEYGRPGYLDVFYKQIEELLTGYGDIFEMWFDSCIRGSGYYGGANEVRVIDNCDAYFNYTQMVKHIRGLQPNCIIWGAEGRGDVFWGGSESGFVKYPYWNVIHDAMADDGENTHKKNDHNWAVNRPSLGKPTKQERWIPLEADVSITGEYKRLQLWYWHPYQESLIYSPMHLMDNVYMKSVGYGANLIINMPLNREGRLDKAHLKPLLLFAQARDQMQSIDFARDAKSTASNVRGGDLAQFGPGNLTDDNIESYWCTDDDVTTGEVELQLNKPATFDVVRVREQIRLGQRVQNFAVDAWVDGRWQTIDAEEAAGKSIGNQVMRRVQPTTTDKLRLRITQSRACPCISEFSLLKTSPIAKDFTRFQKLKMYLRDHPKRYAMYGGGILVLIISLFTGTVLLVKRRRSRRALKSSK